jgi:IS30 family transposase
MANSYNQLSRDERVLIAGFQSQGLSIRQIARQLDRAPSTISRELRRNASPERSASYDGGVAHQLADQRRRDSHRRPRLKTPQLRLYVRQKLQEGWSPEQIAGRLRFEHRAVTVSHEAIYQWIYEQEPQLIRFLTRAHPKRRRRPCHQRRRLKIPCRTSIYERPAIVAARTEAGHWEADTVHWRHGAAVMMIAAERKTRYIRLRPLKRRTSKHMSQSLIWSLQRYPLHLRQSLTYDNGTENAQHIRVNRVLGMCSFFCEPYQSWQKGTVENSVGLVRRYFPKAMDFSQVTMAQVQRVERLLNNRPRKCLNYETPAEAFRRECCT